MLWLWGIEPIQATCGSVSRVQYNYEIHYASTHGSLPPFFRCEYCMGQNLVCIYTLMTIAKRAEQQTLSVRLYQTLQHPPKKIESDRTTRFYPKKMVDLLFYLYILVAVFQVVLVVEFRPRASWVDSAGLGWGVVSLAEGISNLSSMKVGWNGCHVGRDLKGEQSIKIIGISTNIEK